jgi:hypothetical protein
MFTTHSLVVSVRKVILAIADIKSPPFIPHRVSGRRRPAGLECRSIDTREDHEAAPLLLLGKSCLEPRPGSPVASASVRGQNPMGRDPAIAHTFSAVMDHASFQVNRSEVSYVLRIPPPTAGVNPEPHKQSRSKPMSYRVKKLEAASTGRTPPSACKPLRAKDDRPSATVIHAGRLRHPMGHRHPRAGNSAQKINVAWA